jgi:predicted nucleic acid-binding protein
LEHPSSYVVDTSVAIKWYIEKDEADVGKAHDLLDCFGRGQCAVRSPHLLFFEIANALTAAHKLNFGAVMAALTHLRDLNLDLRPLDWATFSKAVEIAAACDATICDSYFLALALETGSILVTADDAFLKKARDYPDVVHLRQLRLPD